MMIKMEREKHLAGVMNKNNDLTELKLNSQSDISPHSK